MWVTAISTGLKFLGAAGSAKKKEAADWKKTQQKIGLEGMTSRQNSQFDAEQQYYYKQLDRAGKARGLDQFRQFSTVKEFNPGYVEKPPQIVMPEKPVFNQGTFAPLPVTK